MSNIRIQLSNKQAAAIANIIYENIAAFCQAHEEEFKKFLCEVEIHDDEKFHGRLVSTEFETGTAYNFTSKPILRKKDNPPPTARTLIDDDILHILTYKGILAIFEKATGKIHLI